AAGRDGRPRARRRGPPRDPPDELKRHQRRAVAEPELDRGAAGDPRAVARGRAEVRLRERGGQGLPVAAPAGPAGLGARPADGRSDPPAGQGQVTVAQTIFAVGTPQTFRATLARALEIEPDDVGWTPSVTAAEEALVEADDPIDVLVLSPDVKEPDALGLAEFVGRTSPMTAIVMVRDKSWNGLLPAAMRAGIRDVVDLTQGSEELRDAVER